MAIKNKLFFLVTLVFLLINNCIAFNNAESEPLLIQAKQADFDKEKGINTYRGDVTITQGDAHATGEIGIAYFDKNNQIKQATLKGNLAHYWTITEANKPELHVWGDKIDVFPDKNIVIVTGHARVEQNHDQLTGDRIVYNLTTHEVRAFSNANTKQRTSITLKQKK